MAEIDLNLPTPGGDRGIWDTKLNAALTTTEVTLTEHDDAIELLEEGIGPVTDNGVALLVNTPGSASRGAIGAQIDQVVTRVSVDAYGAVGDGVTDDKAAIDAALAAGKGGITFSPGRTYSTSGGHLVPTNTTVDLNWSTIRHTGNGICFNFNRSGALSRGPAGLGVGLINGTSTNAAATAVEIGNCYAFRFQNLRITGHTAGVGIRLRNQNNWAEGTEFINVVINGPKAGVQFTRGAGTDSFGYTRIHSLSINVPADGIGIDVASDGTDILLYNSSIAATIWLEGNNAVAMRVGADAAIYGSHVDIVGEVPSNASGIAGHHGLVVDAGGRIVAHGAFTLSAGITNVLTGTARVLAAYRPLDNLAGTDVSSRTYRALATSNPDVAHSAQFGYREGTDQSTPYVAGYDQGNLFSVVGVPFGSKPADGTERFAIGSTGQVTTGDRISLKGTPASVRFVDVQAAIGLFAGTTSPESSVGAAQSSLYLRYPGGNDHGGASVYVKRSGVGNTGWSPVALLRSGATASRPPANQTSAGYYWFDTTLGKPIWSNGTNWVDATGATV